MKFIPFDTLVKTRWKNGGGVTRSIADATKDGTTLWRLSMADVETDGPFSDFTGLTRILTVIKGGGLTLRSGQTELMAKLWEPVRFDGALKVFATLDAGPLTDLNLMFDPLRCRGDVLPLRGPHRQQLAPHRACTHAVVGLVGSARFAGKTILQPGDTLLLETVSGPLVLETGDAALLITIETRDQTEASKSDIAAR